MCYTSNERGYFSLSIHIFHFENRFENRKWYLKNLFLYFYFSIVHISTNYALDGLRFCMHVRKIQVEGTVSQIFVLYLIFDFMLKNG